MWNLRRSDDVKKLFKPFSPTLPHFAVKKKKIEAQEY
jgi:hypothetical protein